MSDYINLPTFDRKTLLQEIGIGFAKIIFRDSLRGNLKRGASKVQDAAWVTAQYMAPRVESYMKLNAPWTDRTGNARNGLAARPYKESGEIGIVLFHQVPYGIFLETRFDGQYGIIDRSIGVMGPRVMSMYDRMLERM